MSEEYFWGLTLDSEKSSGSWDPEHPGEDSKMPGYGGNQTLVIKQAVLGAKAKSDEVNEISVEAMGFKSTIKIPVVSLKASTARQALLDLTFPDPPVTFTLTQGTGPVHLIGNHAIGPIGEEDDELDDDLDMDEEDLEEEEDGLGHKKNADVKKRKSSLTPSKNTKKSKVEENDLDLEDDELYMRNSKGAGKEKKDKGPAAKKKK